MAWHAIDPLILAQRMDRHEAFLRRQGRAKAADDMKRAAQMLREQALADTRPKCGNSTDTG